MNRTKEIICRLLELDNTSAYRGMYKAQAINEIISWYGCSRDVAYNVLKNLYTYPDDVLYYKYYPELRLEVL